MARLNVKKCPKCGRFVTPAFRQAKARANGHCLLILLTGWRCNGCGWRYVEPYDHKVRLLGLQPARTG